MKTSLSKNSAVFLAIVLVAGTISIMIPATFAQSYKDPYAKDQNKKSWDVNFQKVKCNNIIINGVDSVEHGTAGDMINDMSEEDDRTSQDSQWFDNDEKKWSDIDNNIGNFCKNNNTQLAVEETSSLTVPKQIFGCDIFQTDRIMDCRTLDSDSEEWLSWDDSFIDSTAFYNLRR